MSESKDLVKSKKDHLRGLIRAMESNIAQVLPKHLTPERMAQLVLVEASRNPRLYDCTPQSIAGCIMLASELGLEPSGPLGKFYLIPRRNKRMGITECTPLIGYKGYCELARRSGEIVRLNAGVVYQDEIDRKLFQATIEPPSIKHEFTTEPIDRSDKTLVLAYATAEMKDGSKAQIILTREEVDKRRARSAAKNSGPWESDYPAMARKTALRALLSGGLVPLSAESPLAKALEHDIDAPETIEGTVVQVEPEPHDGASRLADAIGLSDEALAEGTDEEPPADGEQAAMFEEDEK
jgi:recombination protein RecT